MEKVAVSTKAYCKIFLHAAKYPYCSVNGVLLCEKDSDRVSFVDVIPMFHQNLTLAPNTEMAFLMIDEICKKKNLMIGGHYHANATVADHRVHPTVNKIMEKIHENSGSAFLFMVNNQKISSECDVSCLDMFSCSEGKWVEKFKDGRDSKPQSYELEDGALSVASVLVKQHLFEELVDMDNHFDDNTKEFQNYILNDLIDNSI